MEHTNKIVSSAHSFIFNFSQKMLDPRTVVYQVDPRTVHQVVFEGVKLPEKTAGFEPLFYTLGVRSRDSLYNETVNLLDFLFSEAEVVLPKGYDIPFFCSMFLADDDTISLSETYADLSRHGLRSFTWRKGVLRVVKEIHKAEGPSSPPLEDSAPIITTVVENPTEILVPQLGQSPLDQFSIYPICDLFIGNYYFSFTNSALFMLLTLVLVVLLFFVVTKKGGGKLVPNAWQSLVELIYDFVLNLVNEQIGGLSGNVKQKFFPCILVTFTFLLFCNLQGMIPFSFTVTSHFLITLALSFSIFIGITIVGFQRHGLHFFSFLLPAGVPLPLAPFLVLLELISYCFRALSLGIRLFANMMAGHSLVKILSGFAWTMLFLNNIFYFIGDLGPLFIVLALTGLELGVAILQAYVFTILICIYLNDAINLH